ncbi:hypothetical protein DTO207G8_3530 [Paecilomyces variotii]|nr:hypothetical protein DTO207G8_3530 [Paecilomyces variotii]
MDYHGIIIQSSGICKYAIALNLVSASSQRNCLKVRRKRWFVLPRSTNYRQGPAHFRQSYYTRPACPTPSSPEDPILHGRDICSRLIGTPHVRTTSRSACLKNHYSR